MNKFLSRLFGRLSLTFLAIVIQFCWMVFLVYLFSEKVEYVNIFIHIMSAVLAVIVLNRDIQPYNKVSWILLILCLPIFGCMCYYIFGRPELTKKNRRKLYRTHKFYEKYYDENQKELEQVKQENYYAYKQARYISKYGDYPIYQSDDIEYFSKVENLFPKLLEDLENAKRFIFLEFFIVDEGYMLDKIMEILTRKVKEGVEVRFIYDDVGCVNTMSRKKWADLEKRTGVKFAMFNKFKPVMSVVMNNRDHRKIVVIDGKTCYTGGFNLADEYINKIERFGYWKDSGVRFAGKPVKNYTLMFLEMWNYINGTFEDADFYINMYENTQSISKDSAENSIKNNINQDNIAQENINQDNIAQKNAYIQPYGDSPLDHEYVGENVYMTMINNAKEYVYIFTPYLIIGSELTQSLINAAKSGVDVRIVTPGIPDKKAVFLLTQSSYEPLIEAGVKMYQYTPGFIHAKCCISDDESGIVGTINFDFRSLYMHFECAVSMFKCSAIKSLKKDFIETFEKSELISIEFTKKRDYIVRFWQSILRAFAPLL
ncbi:cardiolipin synthase [Lachnospiraceae bacterium C7]|nr:cardiolipin synthase [Lachnospiraceae bacterium C7]